MKKCQGTFSYVFSAQDFLGLEHLGIYSDLQADTDSMLVRNFWIPFQGVPFCLQYREIINEDDLLPQQQLRSLERLMPGLIEASDLVPPREFELTQELHLSGMILEDLALTRTLMREWELPASVIWSKSTGDEVSHQLSYRKAFPFWALLMTCPSLKALPQIPFSQNVLWKNQQRALWIPMETTTWDLLICERP